MLELLISCEKQYETDYIVFRWYMYICWTSLSYHFYKNHSLLWKLPVLLASGRIQIFCEIRDVYIGIAEG